MLSDIINFVKTRTGITDDTVAIREINHAWREYYEAVDPPNSLFEISVVPPAIHGRVSLPWYVGQIKGVKDNTTKLRVNLNTPRPYYQNDNYYLSPFTWRILGESALQTTIVNATTVVVKISSPAIEQFTVTLIGQTDFSAETKEDFIFEIGDTEHESTARFIDFSAAKDKVTESDVQILNSENELISLIPNSLFNARNTIVQVIDKASVLYTERWFDILYKKACPFLFYPETVVPNEQIVMHKAVEWVMLSRENGEKRAGLFGQKALNLLTQTNIQQAPIEHRLDVGQNLFVTRNPWHL